MTLDPSITDATRGSRRERERERQRERRPGFRCSPPEAQARPLDDLFARPGWQVRRNVITQGLIETMRRVFEARRRKLQERFVCWSGEAIENEGDLKRAASRIQEYDERGIPKDFRHFLTGEFDLETRLSESMRSLLSAPSLKHELCEFLKADHFLVHYPPMVRFKVAGVDAALVPLHQDSAYNAHMRDFVTVWIPLADVSEESGGLVVYSGSHRRGCVTHQTARTWGLAADADLSEYQAVHVGMKAGDALLLSPHLFHKSAPYSSRASRFSIDLRIFRAASDTTKSYYDPFCDRISRVE